MLLKFIKLLIKVMFKNYLEVKTQTKKMKN